MVPDHLAGLAHPELVRLWDPATLVVLERDLWRLIASEQQRLGLAIPNAALSAYAAVRSRVDLESIRRRELVTRHDVKARIEEYNALAGYELIHLGLTSADVVEYSYAIRLQRSLEWLADRHDRPELASLALSLPVRGLKGAMGTQQDLADLLGQDRARELDERVAHALGFTELLGCVPQVSLRSIDVRVVAALLSATGGKGGAYQALLAGFLTMAAGYAGDVWLEGDVSSSAVRRVALPGSVFACDVCLSNT